jgi:hypothetical protein
MIAVNKTGVQVEVSSGGTLSRPKRVDVSIEAVLTTSDQQSFSVVIQDISASGFRLEAPSREELLVGELVRLQVNGRKEYIGRIKWAAGQVAGGEFTT